MEVNAQSLVDKLYRLGGDDDTWIATATRVLEAGGQTARATFLHAPDDRAVAFIAKLEKQQQPEAASSSGGKGGGGKGGGGSGEKEPAIMQRGSLLEGENYVSVRMQHGDKELQAELLVDTGSNMDLNISDYKADQLGLPQPTKRAVPLEMGHTFTGTVHNRGAIETTLLLDGDGADVLEDPLRSSFLEVWTDAGSSGSGQLTSSSSLPSVSGHLVITVLSPVKKGHDRLGYDAILGAPGMAKLRLGIDRVAGRLYVKQRTSLRRI